MRAGLGPAGRWPPAALHDPNMPEIPSKLEETLELLDLVPDRAERIQLLIDIADRFEEVPPRIARRPFSNDHLVPACESQAYVWGEARPDGTLDFHFAVDNPQGISAKSLAVILGEGLSGAPLTQVAAVPQDLVYRVFGRELSMGKSMGLMGMVSMVAVMARQRLAAAGTL
jgi:cysteine desulfuration protein SufE